MQATNLTCGAMLLASESAAVRREMTVAAEAPVLELKSLMPWLQMQQVKP